MEYEPTSVHFHICLGSNDVGSQGIAPRTFLLEYQGARCKVVAPQGIAPRNYYEHSFWNDILDYKRGQFWRDKSDWLRGMSAKDIKDIGKENAESLWVLSANDIKEHYAGKELCSNDVIIIL